MMVETPGNEEDKNSCIKKLGHIVKKIINPKACFYVPCRNERVSSGNNTDKRKEILKEAIKFHFKNHWEKYMDEKKPRFPYKVIYHVVLVALVIIQVAIFAQGNSKLTRFIIGNEASFEHYFKQTVCNEDIEKLYKVQDVYNQITLIVESYYMISEQAVGSFSHVKESGVITNTPPNLTMEIVYYEVGCGKDESNLFPYKIPIFTWYTDLFRHTNDSVNNGDVSCCNTTSATSKCSQNYCDCSVEDQIKCYIDDRVNNLDRIDRITFDFMLSTFFRERIIEDDASVHAIFQIHITLVNDLYSSMAVNIDVDTQLIRYCGSFKVMTTILDILILVLLILSLISFFVSLVNSFKLAWDAVKCFKGHKTPILKGYTLWKWHIDYDDKRKDGNKSYKFKIHELFNKWYIFMFFTHLLLLTAVITKIIAEYKVEISIPLVEAARILLGIGIFSLLFGVFGLLSYWDEFYELFKTITLAFPRAWKFFVCFLLFLLSFVFCGWLILGPYHPKFKDFSVSLESLYTILNGDDLYTTFDEAHSSSQSIAVKIFSEIYLFLFIFVFIYVVLSLFIGIFEKAFELLPKPEHDEYDSLCDWAKDKTSKNKPTDSKQTQTDGTDIKIKGGHSTTSSAPSSSSPVGTPQVENGNEIVTVTLESTIMQQKSDNEGGHSTNDDTPSSAETSQVENRNQTETVLNQVREIQDHTHPQSDSEA